MDDSDEQSAWLRYANAIAPPQTPGAILSTVEGLGQRLAALEPFETLALLGGLQTEPAFGANHVRLDMAMRLVRLCAKGTSRPTRDKLFRLLNRDLAECGLARMEDPPEDFFLVTIATKRAPYRLFQGIWEKAGAFTEDVVDAFGRLPRSPRAARAFDSAHGLLIVSDILASRAGLSSRHAAGGVPTVKLALPNNRKLVNLRGRCLISWASLERLGINAESLSPFFMESAPPAAFSTAEPGQSDLERCPLAAFDKGIAVVAPHNISTAVRAHLIEAARALGNAEQLRVELLQAQSERLSVAGFARLWDLPVQSIEGHPVKQTVWEPSAGRPIHFLQLVDDFGDEPAVDFGSPSESQTLDRIAAQSINFVRDLMSKRPDFQQGLSVVFLGGWGRAGSVAIPFADVDWEIIAIEPEDAAAICLVGNGKPMDLWRLCQQRRMIEAQGFELIGANGWANLFSLWRETDWTIIPEHATDFQPPAIFNYPTDLLIKVRTEAAERNDRRSLPLPDGSFDVVTRLDRADFFDSSKPTYVSSASLRQGEMLGVVLGRRPIWLKVPMEGTGDRSFDTHETWKAALHWLEVGVATFDETYPGTDRRAVLITLAIDWPPDRFGNPVDNAAIDASLSAKLDRPARAAVLHLSAAWQHGLHRLDNYAELRLAAELFLIVSELTGACADRASLLGMMKIIVGSDDIRWRHSYVADRPLTLLKAHGTIREFEEIPISASALVRCGSTFLSRPRASGPEVSGSDECFNFLMAQHSALLRRLRGNLSAFDRTSLVEAAVSRMVSALAEEETWTVSARALRAIYGADADTNRSLTRRNEINAVIRGASIIAEVAACEAALVGGRAVGDADVDEFMAEAILIFQTAELVPPIRAGFMKPRLRISPTGDLTYDHEFFQSALGQTVQLHHADYRSDADKAYRARFERGVEPKPLPSEFEQAIVQDYAMPLEAFLSFSGGCTELAIQSEVSQLKLSRSELIAGLKKLPGFDGVDLGRAIDALTLSARADWDQIPVGTVASDFDFSRFDRHYSLIRRPIIAISAGDNPTLIVSPPLIERAALHNMAGGIDGSLQDRFWASDAMRKYVGGAAETKGLNFNDSVADFVHTLGPSTFASVKLSDALRHKGTDQVKRLGDIDVLALSSDRRHAWVIEAKDIRFCRTLGETTSRLSEYRGETDARGRRDNLRKHLDRVEYVRRHRGDLAKRYGLAEPLTIHGLVVLDSPQPMAFVPSHTSTDARFMMLTELSELEWSPP